MTLFAAGDALIDWTRSLVLFGGQGLFNGVAQCVSRSLFGQIGECAGGFHFSFRIGRLIHRQTDDDGGWGIALICRVASIPSAAHRGSESLAYSLVKVPMGPSHGGLIVRCSGA